MTQAVLNTQLYQKMFAEQEQFKEELMQLPPGGYSVIAGIQRSFSPAGKSPSEISHTAGGCIQKVG